MGLAGLPWDRAGLRRVPAGPGRSCAAGTRARCISGAHGFEQCMVWGAQKGVGCVEQVASAMALNGQGALRLCTHLYAPIHTHTHPCTTLHTFPLAAPNNDRQVQLRAPGGRGG